MPSISLVDLSRQPIINGGLEVIKTAKQTITADIAIIGGGSGGLSVAAGAAQMGAKVVLVEKGKMGGDCLN